MLGWRRWATGRASDERRLGADWTAAILSIGQVRATALLAAHETVGAKVVRQLA